MGDLFIAATACAAERHGVVSSDELTALGVSSALRSQWVRRRLLTRLGPHSFAVAGVPIEWLQRVAAAALDLRGRGAIAGRSAARLHGLDGFAASERIEALVPRRHRNLSVGFRLCSTSEPITGGDICRRQSIECLTAERTIIEAGRFGLTAHETHNAIDSAIRLRLIHESRLRQQVEERVGRRLRNNRMLVAALVDTGGEGYLERRFLELCREARLPRPTLQTVFRRDGRTVARVDAHFPGQLIVELAGHATHSSRRQRQHDEERRTELTLRGFRVITFTYDDMEERPAWLIGRVVAALAVTESRAAVEIR